jgi:hypothetical protein
MFVQTRASPRHQKLFEVEVTGNKTRNANSIRPYTVYTIKVRRHGAREAAFPGSHQGPPLTNTRLHLPVRMGSTGSF